MSNATAFMCSGLGIDGTTRVFVKEVTEGFEARVGVAIMGSTNRPTEDLRTANPFDEDFQDNYAVGKGSTRQEAIEALKRDIKEMSQTLFL